VAKKSVKKIAAKDADQYMLRLPPGLRDQVARRAAENGRSMNTEIIDAIEKHLRDADRITQLWDLFEKHRENLEAIEKHREDLEAIPHIWDAVEYLESVVGRWTGEETGWPLTNYRYEKEEAARPPITAEEVAEIREGIKELGLDEAKVAARLRVQRIEDLKTTMYAMGLLHQVREDRERRSQRKDPPA
jgi:hypothetical protein